MEHITLYYREGASDKVYQASLHSQDDGYVVTFAYGRRGATLTTGTKTTSPVDYPQAKRVFDKLVRDKTAKGYTPGESGTPYQGTSQASQASGILPQLLNPIDSSQVLKLVHDPRWIMQEKFDGRRLLIRKTATSAEGINRNGLIVPLPEPVVQAAEALGGQFILDGESLGDTFVVFDLLELHGSNLRAVPCLERLFQLSELIPEDGPHLRTAETATSTVSKAAMLERLKSENKEGVVFKKHDTVYTPGRPASGGDALKFKFYETASFVVSRINARRSVSLSLVEHKAIVPAGNVTIGPDHDVPVPGDVVEVRYLYAFPESRCVYQPLYLGKRDDVTRSECTLNQLKFKPASAA